MRRRLLPLVAVPALIGLAACVGEESFQDAAEDFIDEDDGRVAEATGLTFAEVACIEPANEDVGTEFTCTAVGSDGLNYSFVATITGEREFTVGEGGPPTAGATSVPPTSVAGTAPAGTAPAGTAPAAPTTAAGG